jgi:integrase
MTNKRSSGEGTISLRKDGRYVASLTLGYENGKRIRKSFYAKTRREAAEKLNQAIHDQKMGLVVDPKRMSLADFMTQWLQESVKPTVRATTYENYSLLVRVHILPALGTTQLQKLSPLQIQRFLNQKLESGLSTRSVQYLLVILKRSLKIAQKWQLVQRNVALDVDPPKVVHRQIEPLSIEQARQFLESIRGDKNEGLYVTALALGLRRGELLALTWADVNFEAGTLAIRGSLQRVGGRLQILDPKTDKSRRTVIMPQLVVQALRTQRTNQLEHRLALGDKWTDHGLMFPNHFGGLNCPRRLDRQFDEAILKAGLPKIRLHDLRHGTATMLLSQGVDIKTISGVLGHSTTRMTMDVYAHVLDSMKVGAAKEIDRLLAWWQSVWQSGHKKRTLIFE